MIYTVENTVLAGKAARVFVNGNEVRQVIRADDQKGEATYVPEPARLKKGSDEVYTRKLRGKVTVKLSDLSANGQTDKRTKRESK